MSRSTTTTLRPGTLLSPGVSGPSKPAATARRPVLGVRATPAATQPGFPTQALAPGELCRLPDARWVSLVVTQGQLWITRREDPNDHFLRAGQQLALSPVRNLLLENDGPDVAIFHWEALR